MSVNFNTGNINDLRPTTMPMHESIGVAVKKQDLKDFFPKTEKNYIVLFRQMDFRNKLTKVIEDVYKEMKDSNTFEEHNDDQSSDVTSRKLIDFQRESYKNHFDTDLKNNIAHRLLHENWYEYEQTTISDQMYEMSRGYFKATGKEVAWTLGTRIASKGVSKITHLNGHNKLFYKKQGGIVGRANTYSIGATKKDITVNKILKADIRFGQSQRFTLVDTDMISANVDIWKHVHDDISEENFNSEFETIDCMKPFGIASIGLGLNPYVAIASTATNIIYNTGFGIYYHNKAKQIKTNEIKDSVANSVFNNSIAACICEDFKALDNSEIYDLMRYLEIKL